MAGTAVVQSGDYELEIDAGFLQDAFILDADPQGVLDNSVYVLDGTTSYASILESCVSVNVKRGRRDIGDQFTAGTMSFVLSDTSGIFNPFDEQSPYWDTNEEIPGLAPMRKVQLSRYDALNVKEYLFLGYVVNYDYNFGLGELDSVTVYCADDFYLLSQTFMNEFNVSEELSSVRVSAVLDLPEVNFPALQRDIETGTQTLGGSAAFTVANGTNVLQYLAQINDAEQGRLFMTRDGILKFEPRVGQTLSAPVADFHDDGTEIPYSGLGISFQADQVVNRASVTILGSNNPQIAEDAGSIATYFIQTQSITSSLLHDDSAALVLADYLLSPQPEARFTSVQTGFVSLNSAQQDIVSIIDIGSTITIEKTFPSGATTTELAQELSVEGLEWRLDLAQGASITLFTSPTTIVFEFILNDALYGKLDIQDPQPVLG
jgi:hypothetical protein